MVGPIVFFLTLAKSFIYCEDDCTVWQCCYKSYTYMSLRDRDSELLTYAILTSFLRWSKAVAIYHMHSLREEKLYIHQHIEYEVLASFSLAVIDLIF